MSWACTHCILPSCPPSNQEWGGGWGGDRGGQAGEELPGPTAPGCCRAGSLEGAGA